MAQFRASGRYASDDQTQEHFELRENDELPGNLIRYFQDLPADVPKAAESTSERPSKKRKAAADINFITVFRDELSIFRPITQATCLQEPITRSDFATGLWVEIVTQNSSDGPTECCVVLATEEFRAVFFISPTEVPQTAATLLQSSGIYSGNPGRPGCLWKAIYLNLEEQLDDRVVLKLRFEFNWNEGTPYYSGRRLKDSSRHLQSTVLKTLYGDIYPAALDRQVDWSPQDFYEAAHVPQKQAVDDFDLVKIPGLETHLYPFQQRTIQWLLNQEGARLLSSQDGRTPKVQKFEPRNLQELPLSFIKIKDADNRTCYISDLFGVATRDIEPFLDRDCQVRGGILAEEMGLGKTIEIMGLISLHRREEEPGMVLDPYSGNQVQPINSTLIVTPNSLKEQWLSELARHAPGLRVMFYDGIRRTPKDETSEESLMRDLSKHDVVVTTYNVLSKEIDFAVEPPNRSMRYARQYHRPKSPLVQMSWWRVCLDEAQMVDSGVSIAAMMVRLIPRVNAWAISGTPIKNDVRDLRGLLLFLRYEPFASGKSLWEELTTNHKECFKALFNRLALRHTKRLVRDELSIPAQRRYVITMPFTAVEEQHYQTLFKALVEECGFDEYGSPRQDYWHENMEDGEKAMLLEKMRQALDRLRQTALHPEVGNRNRRALGHKGGPMRTVTEVLDAMVEQSENALRADQRALLTAQLTRGQLLEETPRVKEALAIWEDVLRASEKLVAECREHLENAIEQEKSNNISDAARPSSVEDDDEYGERDENATGKVGDARRRLRSALEIEHKAVFFCANAQFQIKTNVDMTAPDSDEFKTLEELEVEGYERAKKIRKEILQETHAKASSLMKSTEKMASMQSFATIPELKSIPPKGIESRAIIEGFGQLCAALDEQANQLDDWREHIIQLLRKPLVDEDEDVETTGEEYEDSTKIQEEIIVYVQAIRTVIADRSDTISGQVNNLVGHEAKVAIAQAKEGEGPFPERLLELFNTRAQIKPQRQLGSLRASVAELRALANKLRGEAGNNSRARLELEIVMEQLKLTQGQVTGQTKVITALEQEVDLYKSAMNARVEYYRQLQAVSDMVATYEGPKNEAVMEAMLRDEEQFRQRLATASSTHRYLLHLKEAETSTEEQRMCTICQSMFTIGVLTVCGHKFCKECFTLWYKAHHNCPMCRRRLATSDLHDINLKPQELKVHSEGPVPTVVQDHQRNTNSKKSTIYSEFSSEKLADIKNIELEGPSFTTKVDTLVRHLIWLREVDPGAKSIIFSQYKEFLDVLALAFSRYRIGFSSFDKPNDIKAFKQDPSVECFLLHARAHASGLNLVNASHVFLCEPLLNTALELQAIARVHRIGQQQETTIWLYIVEGTVEESIYNISVQRRMEHMGRNLKGKSKESTPELLDANLEAANTIELQEATLSKLMGKGSSGERVDPKDYYECLFGHIKRPDDSVQESVEERARTDRYIRGWMAAEAAEERRRNEEPVA